MIHDNDTARAIHALGQTAFNMRYETFCEALDLDDDQYARDKYADLKTLARAMAPFSDNALASLTAAYASRP